MIRAAHLTAGIVSLVAFATAPALKALSPRTDWVRNGTFYEIYPQTFLDSNGDGTGDLKGITSKLGYVKSLGVAAIWLNPFYESSFRDAGYDVTDYYKVAPRYGTNEDARELFRESHRLGMKVIIDFVPGHTSIDHPWFKESAKPTPNKYSNWYVWTSGTWFSGVDRNQYTFIQGYSERDGSYLTNFFWHQPALNYGFAHPDPKQPWQLPMNHPDVRAMEAEMEKVMRYWLDLGCDGFRVDMAGSLIKGDDDGSECSRYWRGVRAHLEKDYPGIFLVSEWSDPVRSLSAGFDADFLHWIPEYPALYEDRDGKPSYFSPKGGGDIGVFLDAYMSRYNATRSEGYISLPFANHDLPRIHRDGREDRDVELIYAFELTMPGVPFLYYGDEIGMRQLYGLPATEGSYGSRAGGRTPMQWSSSPNLGFSSADSAKLYRALDLAPDAQTVESAEANPASLIHKVRDLVALRSSEPALAADAEFVPLFAKSHAYPFVYLRRAAGRNVLVVLNPSSDPVSASFTLPATSSGSRRLAGANGSLELSGTSCTAKIQGRSYYVAELNP